MTEGRIYESDPEAAPDEEFESATLAHLAPGNRGRLLDARRTPIVIRDLLPELGMLELEIVAFEDSGARWQLGLEWVDRLQFERSGPRLDEKAVASLAAARQRFDETTVIPCDQGDRRRTERRIADRRRLARRHLAGAPPVAALEAYLAELGHDRMDAAFAERFVSNPGSGELVKGHAMVLARLGLCPYRGGIQRSRDLFSGEWTQELRAEHITARVAFVRELYARLGQERVLLYRGVGAERPLAVPQLRSFVSATSDPRVAEAHYRGGPRTLAAALYRQSVPVERLFMTHLETRALNRQFRESEVILIGDPASPQF